MEQNPFSRTQQLIGEEGLKKLRNTRVAIFGIGGVGSFVAEGLARAGIGHLYLIDDDVVKHSNINRQIHADYTTLHQPKVQLMKDRILSINPNAEVVIHQKRYAAETAEELFPYGYDYIVDAIDSVTSKIDLILRAIQNNIPIVSSMGTGNKLDPTRFEVTDISKTSVCPLARVMRRELKQRGVARLKVIYSKEQPVKPLQSVNEAINDETDAGAETDITYHDDTYGDNQCNGEVRANQDKHENEDNKDNEDSKSNEDNKLIPHIRTEMDVRQNTIGKSPPGSISFVPSVAGMILAGEVVRDLLGINRKL